MVSNVSSGMILNYVNYLSKKKMSLEDMFKQFSVSLGGDGKTIKKKDIEDYIKKAERGEVKVSAQKLRYLKMVRDNWDKYFKDQDSITYEDFKNNIGLFVGIIAEDTKVEEKEEDKNKDKDKEKDYQNKQKDKKDKDDEKLEIFNKYLDELKEKLNVVEKGLTKDNLKEYLTALATRSDVDPDASAEIGLVTNLISDFDSITGGKEYLNSIKNETQYESSGSLKSDDFSSPVNFKI